MSMPFPTPENEAKRLEALHRYELLDTPPERTYDDFTQIASYICGTPIASITLIDANRQWFKARVGLDSTETPREHAFCAHTIMEEKLLLVEDATSDARFASNPFVTDAPHIRFYAGVPLIDSEGFGLGALCVIDRKPRQLSPDQLGILSALARQVVTQFEHRRVSSSLAAALSEVTLLRGFLPICAFCKGIRDDEGYWKTVEYYISRHTSAQLSHCICPDCLQSKFPEVHATMVLEGKI